MKRTFINNTRQLFPRINLTFTNSKNVKTTYSYPIVSGQWITKLDNAKFNSMLFRPLSLCNNTTNSIQLVDVKEMIVFSDDFEKIYKYYIDVENNTSTNIYIKIDNYSDAISYFKIF